MLFPPLSNIRQTPNLLLFAFLLISVCISGQVFSQDAMRIYLWDISIDTASGKTKLSYNGTDVLSENQAVFKIGSQQYKLEDMDELSVESNPINDHFGPGTVVKISATGLDGSIHFLQSYYFYEDYPFLLTDFTLSSDEVITSNYMAPIHTENASNFLPAGQNTVLWVPFDNDKWVRYQAYDFGRSTTSYEVGAFFNAASRQGLIAGSVEHDNWKTGVRSNTQAGNIISSLEVFGGVTSTETRDNLPHGALKGNSVKSPLIFIGLYNDWRKGMEDYADANRIISPRLPWNQGKPFGWNSWGAIQTNLSYQNASETAVYIAENLQNNDFQNDSTVYIGLDSYWDNITYSNLVRFVRECKSRGQNPGIYWSPFVDWGRNPDRPVEGSTNVFYRDIYLYANGQPQEIASAYAIDPTHPVSKRRMDLYLERFITQGFTYLKLDFLTHGSLESDAYYNPEVTTGIQAYNEGLQYILDVLGDRMFINFSIAPLFPGGQYAHSRRIACDAYAGINDTEYTLNSLTYGWWLDRVYTYNDADNVVLAGVSLGENRARYTSSVITGIICVGDDFSNAGFPTARQRAELFFTNREVNRVARFAKAFYPVETATGGSAAQTFMQTVEDTLYLAAFNYSSSHAVREIDMQRIGLEPGVPYVVHELWSDEKEIISDKVVSTVPRRDVKFFKIYRDLSSDIRQTQSQPYSLYPNPGREHVHISGNLDDVSEIIITNLSGQVVRRCKSQSNSLNTNDLKPGIYIITLLTKDADRHHLKMIRQ